ncbi:TetR/AcrR family transcriptional regulator [Mycobacterium sp. pUA109]|uniref:TetR/AcrR family transcriptional regulator n=1 Tax=Mycobacterium sp. pUA109 TaxID=3238982 RepID=UPI00351B215E
MARDDWLLGASRQQAASERIYAAATDLIARKGLEAFSIDTLAARVHCSPATIYRHVGGKANIRDEVLIRAGSRIVDTVRREVENLSGPDRVVTAITTALAEIRSHPLGQLMFNSIRAQEMAWLKGSAIVAGFATELNGLSNDDEQAVHWILRVVMSLMYWPADDAVTERQIVERFVAPAFRP